MKTVAVHAMPPGWSCEEPGWWVHEKFGGICREEDGKWYGYPVRLPESERIGPFPTAKIAAESVVQSVADAVRSIQLDQ